MHVPPLHTLEAGQPRPHTPQLLPSLVVSTQRLPHRTCPVVQTHSPRVHAPFAQTRAQTPQCSGFDLRSTHAPAQALRPPVQDGLQTPALQTGVVPSQRTPQAPQFSGSDARSTQLGPHRSLPTGHEHFPPMQTSEPEQVAPQAEQCRRSVAVSTHEPAQSTRPALHDAAHEPRSQTGVASEHDAPHCPQLFGSLWRSAQDAPQAVSCAAHDAGPGVLVLAPSSPPSEGPTASGKSNVIVPHAEARLATATIRAAGNHCILVVARRIRAPSMPHLGLRPNDPQSKPQRPAVEPPAAVLPLSYALPRDRVPTTRGRMPPARIEIER